MKKTFLKSIIATAVTVCAVGVMSVAALADTNTYYYVVQDANDINTSNYFTLAKGSNTISYGNSSNSYTGDVNFDGESTTYNVPKGVKMESATTISFTVNGTATLEVLYGSKVQSSIGNCSLKLDGNNWCTVNTATYESKKYLNTDSTVATLSAGKHTISRNSGEGRLYGIKVVDTTEGSVNEYTISGTSNVKNQKHTLTINGTATAVTTDADGKWSTTYSSTAAPATATLSAYGYYASADSDAATLTLTANGTALTASAANFTAYELADLSTGTYDSAAIAGDLTKFVATEDSWKAVSGARMFVDKTLSFKLSAPATVVVNAQSGSSEAAVKLALNGGTAQEVPAGVAANYTFNGVEGTNTLTVSRDDGGSDSVYLNSITITYPANTVATTANLAKPAVISDGTTYYAIAVISSEDANKSTVTISATDATPVTSSTVYSTVTINGVPYTANDLSTVGGAYLFAFKVESNGATTLSAEAIQSAVSVAVA